jgi:hypothetical protein
MEKWGGREGQLRQVLVRSAVSLEARWGGERTEAGLRKGEHYRYGRVQNMTNVLVTKEEGVAELKKAVQAWLKGNPENLERMPMAEFRKASGWDYSRTWQVARRWVIEARTPDLLVNTSELVKGLEVDKVEATLSRVVVKLHDDKLCSWGEINVRMGLSEGRVRKLYKYSGKKDIGQRTGQGGRFVYQDPTLYLEHMKKEGAVIPTTLKGRPKVEECLNAKPKAPKARRTRKTDAKLELPPTATVQATAV